MVQLRTSVAQYKTPPEKGYVKQGDKVHAKQDIKILGLEWKLENIHFLSLQICGLVMPPILKLDICGHRDIYSNMTLGDCDRLSTCRNHRAGSNL